MTMFGIDQIQAASGQVKGYVEVKKEMPVFITVAGYKLNRAQFLRLLTGASRQIITGDMAGIDAGAYQNATNPQESIKPGILSQSEYVNIAERVSNYMDRGVAPNYAGSSLGNIGFLNLIYIYSCIVYAKSPKSINVKPFPTSTTPVTKTQYVQAFQGAVGKTIDTYTQGYNAIKNRIYLMYFNDIYKVDVALQRLKDKAGLNCADIVQLMYQLGLDLGYQVRVVHIVCQSGTGHMQLDIKGKEFGDSWKRHDPAKALSDGGDLGTLWCANGTVISYDDSWMLSDDGIT